ncbi:hypothetical protein [Kushneria indalinina]|uniref:Uncharacterized protein n=1 Tax=Kushneria indalinina DSM 14324 TaxID=1122140 RepID=A0A3D9DRJ7_9GAMM|nr:hypothetical protein [Kushneria indalinina]REC93368.1 hypothetical protein C8D72_3412 [Kushneria indalinina DSM 14324]
MSPLHINNTMSLNVSRHLFHLLPVLQVDPFDRVAPENIKLTVTVSWRNQPVEPDEGWIIHQPYPNKLYFVAGSQLCSLGRFIQLPDDQHSGTITFQWLVEAPEVPPGYFRVDHQLDIAFAEGRGNTWSMDVANWWALSEYATEGHSKPEIGRNRFSRIKRQGISPSRRASVSEATQNGCRHISIHESLTLPAIALSSCWTVATYGGEDISNCLETIP